MSDNTIRYEPQSVAQTVADASTIRDNQLTFSGDHSINISRVDTTSSETRHDKFKVFGTYLQVKSPYRMGKMFTFLFMNREPVFAIGPQCNICLFRLYVDNFIFGSQFIQRFLDYCNLSEDASFNEIYRKYNLCYSSS